MRRNITFRTITLAVASSLLLASAASAQVEEPFGTPPPNLFKGVRTAVITSALTDPAINAVIDAAGLAAHEEIGGTSKRYWTGTLPTPRNVSIAARDLAELEHDIVVATGGDSQRTVGAAGLHPNSVFLDIGQALPCVTRDGRADPSGTCEGGLGALPSNYSSITFAVDEAAYLAGIIAAGASRRDRLGIISGLEDCKECRRYLEGFQLGARSAKPNIDIDIAYLADDDVEAAFGAPDIAKTFAEAFINVYRPDVLFPVAGSSGVGMIEAACDAGILAVGSDLDVAAAYPDLAECILTSVTKDMETAVRESIFSVTNAAVRREWLHDLASGGVSLTDDWRSIPGLPVDLPARYEGANERIVAGLVDTCPVECPKPEAEPEPSEAPLPDTPARTEAPLDG